jgi:hypothetical protein
MRLPIAGFRPFAGPQWKRDIGSVTAVESSRTSPSDYLSDEAGALFYKVPGPTSDEYTFAHNAIMTLVGPEGGIVARFSSDAVVYDLARTLRRLIDPARS